MIASFTYVRQLNVKNIINAEFYQYVGGQKQEYAGEIELNKEGEITKLRTINVDIDLDSTPMYYKQEPKVLFPDAMQIIYPIEGASSYRIPRFTSAFNELGVVYVEVNKKEIPLQNGFLYDGADLYVFVEPITVTVDEEEYKLNPLSYVNVEYNGDMEIYNYSKDEDIIIDIKDKQVTAKNESYTIDLNVDSIKYEEKEQLLLKKFDKIKILDE